MNYKIDLSSQLRELKDENGVVITEPLCLGVELDESSTSFKFTFENAPIVDGCFCFVQLEAANGEKSLQEMKTSNSAVIDDNNSIVLGENITSFDLVWKPNSFLTQEKGLVKFAFQFYKIDVSSGKYSLCLNTSPIDGIVHVGLNAAQIVAEKNVDAITELYEKYNELLDDKDISDLDSIFDIRNYLFARVPSDLTDKNTTANSNVKYLVAYDPKECRYYYTPALEIDGNVIYGNIWNTKKEVE